MRAAETMGSLRLSCSRKQFRHHIQLRLRRVNSSVALLMAMASHHERGHYRKVHRYSGARRDRALSLWMLAGGSLVIAVLMFLILTK